MVQKQGFIDQGRNEGETVAQYNASGDEPLGAPKNPNNVTSTFFNIVHLLRKALGSNMGASNLLLAPGAI